jgi:hypothetical protein
MSRTVTVIYRRLEPIHITLQLPDVGTFLSGWWQATQRLIILELHITHECSVPARCLTPQWVSYTTIEAAPILDIVAMWLEGGLASRRRNDPKKSG